MYKVLHVTYSTDSGGIGSVILNYYDNINREKIHFDLAQCENYKGTAIKRYEEEQFKIYYIGNKTGVSFFKHIFALYKILKKEKYDAIHVHTAHTSWVDLMVALLCGIKVRIVHAHNAERNIVTIKQKLRVISGRILLDLFSTKKIACGRDAALFMYGKNALYDKKVIILPNAIDLQKYKFSEEKRNKIRRELRIADATLVYGTVGRLSFEKNQIFLINILESVVSLYKNAVLLIVGDGVDKEKLEHHAKSKDLIEHIIFTGNRNDVDCILSAMDVFILPSLYEGFPVSAMEAKASGLPVVLSDTITDELNSYGQFSYLSLKDHYDCWAKEIVDCFHNKCDREKNGLINEERVDIKKTASLLEQLYLNG